MEVVQPIQAPAPAPSPFEQRQWRKEAQRAVRLALLGVRDARKVFAEACSAGYKDASEMGNNLLLQQYLHEMQLGVLRGVPGLRESAAEKLVLQQRRASDNLHAALRKIDGAVQSLRASLKDVIAKHQATTWQQNLPVFSTLTLGQILAMLEDLLGMYDAELSVKKSLVHNLDAAANRLALGKNEDMKPLVNLYITTWVSNPKLREDLAEQRLAILAEDMAGY